MPFEPLQTDEKLQAPIKRERDMDTQMLVGCSGFVMTALMTYALSVWPHFVWTSMHKIPTLVLCGLVGGIPAVGVGIYAVRRMGLAGACGFIGGSMATGIFIFLRMKEMFVLKNSKVGLLPDYPESWIYIIPAVWVLVVFLLGVLLLPRGELPEGNRENR